MKSKKAPKGTTVLIGPMGVGKSLLAKELSKKTGMPVLQLDIMRHCPKTIREIEKSEYETILDVVGLKEELNNVGDKLTDEARENIVKAIRSKENFISVCEKRKKLRAEYPELINYESIGYKFSEQYNIIEKAKECGMDPNIVWSYYQKFYEIEFLRATVAQLKKPVILDLGGGVPIVLKEEFEKCEYKARLLFVSNLQLRDAIPYTPDEMQKELDGVFESFDKSKIVSLHLPENYEEQDRRSARDKLTKKFIKSGQYDNYAGATIDTTGMVIEDGVVDEEVVAEKVSEIIAKTNNQEKCQ